MSKLRDITASAAGEGMSPPSIYALLAAYWQAQEEHSLAIDATDRAATGSAEEDAARAVQFAASDRAHEALLEICRFVPRLRFEAKHKHTFLTMALSEGSMDDEAMAAMIEPIAKLVHWNTCASVEKLEKRV